ncbi:cytokine receptor-like [Malaya genurostris]|uniref:cytokine receptor-like n=1 Tax=Malaya genurostris TaxID=325434 RepID=UPI0026F3D0A5|nr:cytokine receptor-like [Malaya genurostris]
MFVIVVMLCVTRFGLADEFRFIYGSVFKSAREIDLQSNVTSYTVGCKLESTRTGINSQFLSLYVANKKVDSQIENVTTITVNVKLHPGNESEVCGVKTYVCKLNQTIVDSTTVFVGKPPVLIEPSDFKCISENREFLWCEFTRNDYCNLHTLYKLSMIRHHVPSECVLDPHVDKQMRFDSRSNTCQYSAGQRSITFELESQNVIGRTVMEFHMNHYDLVRPVAPSSLQVLNISTTSVDVAWSLNEKLLNLDRKFEYQFLFVSEFDLKKNIFATMPFDTNEIMVYSIHDLTPYTGYELFVRARVVPMAPRKAENEYWSAWVQTNFKTKSCKPNQAPITAPGAYSLSNFKGDFVTVEVYWQQVSQLLRNGPGFKYNVTAVSKTGERFHPTSMSNGTALFHQLKIDFYQVQISCYNEEGSSDFNVIEIFPPTEGLRPIIKRILLDDRNYVFSWYPVQNAEQLLNYTIIYCNFTATGSCRDATGFAVIPATETTFNITSELVLNLAVAANYRNYSSDLSWQKCVVSSHTGITQPKFSITDITASSLVVRMNNSCTDRSLVKRYEASVWTTDSTNLVEGMTFNPYVTVIPITNLNSNTEYNIIIAAYDDSDASHQTAHVVTTKHSDALLYSILYLLGGIAIFVGLSISTSRKVKKMMNIKVDIPLGLMGIDETNNGEAESTKPRTNYETIRAGSNSVNTSETTNEHDMTCILTKSNINFYSQMPSSFGNWKRPKNSVQMLADDAYVLPSQISSTVMEKLKDQLGSSSGYVGLTQLMSQTKQ